MLLPHEHVFVDLRTWDQPGYAEADPAAVTALMGPEIERARAAGVTAIVECSTVGVGRRADIDRAVSVATGFPLVVPTGHLPRAVGSRLGARGQRGRPVRVDARRAQRGDRGHRRPGRLDQAQRRRRRADRVRDEDPARGRQSREGHRQRHRQPYDPGPRRARSARHHRGGRADPRPLHLDPHPGRTETRASTWRSPGAAPGSSTTRSAATTSTTRYFVARIADALAAGLGGRLLLSQDRGWYDPAQPGGGTPRPYTYLSERFLPQLRTAGVDEAEIARLTERNPFDAFAR